MRITAFEIELDMIASGRYGSGFAPIDSFDGFTLGVLLQNSVAQVF